MQRFWNHLLRPVLNTIDVRSIIEVGAGSGLHTDLIAGYCKKRGAHLTSIDPLPQFDVAQYKRRYGPLFTFQAGLSLDVLPACESADAVFLDGDHNWYTVIHELRLITQKTRKEGMPVVFVHDVDWPYGRRDMYYDISTIPAEGLQPYAKGGLRPGTSGVLPDTGLHNAYHHAILEGGPKNGIRTAIEDFLRETGDSYVCKSFAGFHGLIVLVPTSLFTRNEALRDVLDTRTPSQSVAEHIALLEHERTDIAAGSADLRRIVDSNAEAESRLKAEIEDMRATLHHFQQTRSWKITAPLRVIPQFFRPKNRREAKQTLVKKLWVACGSPFPILARRIRHEIIGHARLSAPTPSGPQTSTQFVQYVFSIVPVSVIVTARNNGPYLRECLESILSQSVKPLEILYADDGSTDDSVEIASSFKDITVFAGAHQGVCAARNAAVARSTGDYLLHIDGDDVLTPTYLADLLYPLVYSSDAAFAYGSMQLFGSEEHLFDAVPWDKERLWKCNYVNSSSLVRRKAFEAVGGWRDTVGTLWDWDLWLRVERIGPGLLTPAVLRYRRHDANWSKQTEGGLNAYDHGRLYGRSRRAVARTSVCAIVSGRLLGLTEVWIDALCESITSYDGSGEPPELVILDNSDGRAGEAIRTALARKPHPFRAVTIVPYPVRFTWKEEMERRHKVAGFLATAYNRLLAIADGDILWFVEDDVVVPPHAYGKLLEDLTDGITPLEAVTGEYRSRHVDELIAHRLGTDNQPAPIAPGSAHTLFVDLAGTGCLMIFRAIASHPFTAHWRGYSPAHDWAWCEATRAKGGHILLDPAVRCRHYQTLTEYV